MQYPSSTSFHHNSTMENARTSSILGKRGSDFDNPNPMQASAFDATLTNPAAVNIAPDPSATHQYSSPPSGMMMNGLRPSLPPPSHPQQQNQMIPTAAGDGSAENNYMPQSMGLEFAKMKKEEAREGFKLRRRHELIQIGEVDRIKRRRKNDTSISEHQKYNRRLKMNQDSAAAARYAQEMYVATLEKLVCRFEMDRNQLSTDLSTVTNEKMQLKRILDGLQKECAEEDAPRRRMPTQSSRCSIAPVNSRNSTSFFPRTTSRMPSQNVSSTPVSTSPPQQALLHATRRMSLTQPPVSSAPLSRAPSMASAASATDSLVDVMVEIPELSEIAPNATDSSTSTGNNSQQQEQGETLMPFVKQGSNNNLEKKDSKKMTDLYDPSFLMSLGLDGIDFSKDIIDMHPVA